MGIEGLIGLIAGIMVVVIIVALCIIFRKKIAAFFKNKSDAKKTARAKKQEEQSAKQSVVGNVFKKEEKPAAVQAPAPEKQVTAGEHINAANFTVKEEPKPEPQKDFNVMSQFNKK